MKNVTLVAILAITATLAAPALARRRAPRESAARHFLNTGNPSGVFALYQNPNFGYAVCLAKPEESPDAILQRNGITALNASAQERAALAKGILQVNRLLGGPIPKDWRVNYRWVNGSGTWNSEISRAGFVTIKRPPGSPKGTLTGRMMHELGHKFGHANGARNYADYARYTRGNRCRITTYSRKNINEEFAEAFEAYVTHPDFLAKNCPDSFAFFQKQVFKNSPDTLAVCGRKEEKKAVPEKARKVALEEDRRDQAEFNTATIELDRSDAEEERAEEPYQEQYSADLDATG